MRQLFKTLYFKFQDFAYYASLTDGEYAKFGRFFSPTIAIVTLLRVSGVIIKFWQIAVAYLIIYITAVLIGLWLDYMKVPHYSNRLGNSRNEELSEIVEWIRKQK